MKWNELFDYDDGKLIWKKTLSSRGPKGSIAGTIRDDGRIHVGVSGKHYKAHRVIWEMLVGPIPDGMFIDHIDRNPANNRIENLRVVTPQQNSHNNGAKGFCWVESKSKFMAYIKISNKSKTLGYFDNILDARSAYLRAKRQIVK